MSSWPPPLSDPAYLTYLAAFGAAALGCLAGAERARHIEDPGVRRGLVGLLGTSGLWALAHVGVMLSPTLWLKVAFYQGGLIVGFGTVWAWLWLCSAYSGRSLHLRWAARWAALGVFAAAIATKLTNPWHGLYFSADLVAGPFLRLQVDHHVLYWLTSSLSYALAAVGFFMLVEPLRRIQVGAGWLAGLFGLTVLPLGANAVGYATPLLLDLSHEPIGVAAFAIGALFVYRSRFKETSQAGRWEQPALVVSEGGRLQNYNEAASGAFPMLEKSSIGKSLQAVLPEVAEAIAGEVSTDVEGVGVEEGPRKTKTVQVGGESSNGESCSDGEEGAARYVRPVEGSSGPGGGRLVVLEDVTEEVLRHRASERKREEELRRQMNLLEQAQRLAGAWEFDLETGEISWSEKVYEIHEVEPGTDLTPEEALQFYVPEVRPQVGEAFERCAEEGEPYDLELPIITAKGNRRWVRTVGAPAETEEGEVVKVAGAFQDITERRRDRRRLERYREYTSQMVDAIDDLFFVLGEAGRLERWNRRFREVTGYTDEEIGRMRAVDLVPEGYRGQVESEIERVLSTGDGQVEVPLLLKGGSTIPYEFIGDRIEDPDGNPRVVVVGRDISERLERERELGQAETLFENAQDALFLINVERGRGGPMFRVQRVNPAYEEATGLSAEEVEGHLSRDIVGEEHGAWIEDRYRECTERREPLEYEEELPIKGTTHWQTRIAPVEVGGSVEKIVGSTRDVTERRRRTRKLKRYERIVENLPVGAFRTTASGEFVELNEALTKIYGGSEQELREAGVEALYPDPADREKLIETLQREGETRGRLIRMQTLAGEERWIRATITFVDEGEERYLDGIVQDVTEKRRREKELERQNDLFEKAEELASVGGWEYDVSAGTLTLTDQAYRVHGLDPSEEAVPDRVHDLYHPEDRAEVEEAFRKAIEEGEPYDLEARLITEEGERRWARTSGEPQTEEGEDSDGEDLSGEVTRVRGAVRDITERKRREQDRTERQEKVEALYRAANRLLGASSETEVAGLLVNLIREALGYRGVSVRLAREDQLVPVRVSPETMEFMPERPPFDIDGSSAVAEVYRTGEILKIEDLAVVELEDPRDYGDLRSVVVVPMGEHGTFAVASPEPSAISGFDTRLIEVLGTYGTAVLDRLGREEALREAKEEAEEAVRLKTAVLANMSHEIRTPLTPVIGFAESLAADLDGPEARVAKRIKRSAQRLQETLDSVLRLAQLEAGTLDLDREEVDLRTVVREASDRVGLSAKEKEITIETDLPGHPVRGRVSEDGVRRIAENLLENAVKFTPEGGRVKMQVRRGAEEAAEEEPEKDPQEVILEVEDTGIGIGEEAQEEIFEAFGQESKGHDREYEGTGLGLSVVRRLAEAHGGSVEVESEKGKGSRFIVRLPREEPPSEPARGLSSTGETTSTDTQATAEVSTGASNEERAVSSTGEGAVFRRMHQITADPEATFDEKTARLIELGTEYLDLPHGHLTRISDETQEILKASGGHPLIQPGATCPLSEAYCRKTIEEESLLAIQNAPAEGWGSELAYEKFGLGAYVGAKVMADGEVYGTFCFAAAKPRDRPFSLREKAFVELLARWTSYEIERRRAEKRLERQNERLEQFSGALTHDLRNPLNVAQGRLSIALEEMGGDADLEASSESASGESASGESASGESASGESATVLNHLRASRRALRRMGTLIEDMLALTWGEQELAAEDMEEVSLQKVAEDSWTQIEAREATLQIAGDLELRAHEGRLRQLLENLFRNAIEHGGEAVSVTVRPLPEEEGQVGFCVEDDGPGIPEEKWDEVFERGYSSEAEGTGLGLSIVASIAEAHGGTVGLEGKKGEGTCFTVRLPAGGGGPNHEGSRR